MRRMKREKMIWILEKGQSRLRLSIEKLGIATGGILISSPTDITSSRICPKIISKLAIYLNSAKKMIHFGILQDIFSSVEHF